MKYLLILVSIFFLSSCGGGAPEIKVNNGTPIPVDSGPGPYSSASPGNGSSSQSSAGGGVGGGEVRPLEEQDINVMMVDGRGIAEFTIKSGSRVLLKFDGVAGRDLTANLIGLAGDVSGYRFSQLLFPDGGSDGPFEKSVAYTLSSTGKYGLRITPYTSGGTPGGGKMRVEIFLR